MVARVKKSIHLIELVNLIEDDEQSKFWYVDRRARFLEFKIKLSKKQKSDRYYRLKRLDVECFHILKDKILFKKQTHSAGSFFDKYHEKGHFFSNKNDAVNYMHQRVETGRDDVVKSACKFIDKHPEYLV